ncbi:MAG: hypothetical protein ABIL07_01210 [candidate division WOR-3 bacterium]
MKLIYFLIAGLSILAILIDCNRKEEFKYFETPVDSLQAPDTINVNETLPIILFGTFTNQIGDYPQIDHIEHSIDQNIIQLKAIAKIPSDAESLMLQPYLRPWMDTLVLRNLASDIYIIKARGWNDTPIVDTVVILY